MDLPREPNVITIRDVHKLQEIREGARQDWTEYEERNKEMRQQMRQQLKTCRRATVDENTSPNLGKVDHEEDISFAEEKARLELELEQIRMQKMSGCSDMRDRTSDVSTHVRDSLSSTTSTTLGHCSSPEGSDVCHDSHDDASAERAHSGTNAVPESRLEAPRRPSGKGKGKGAAPPPPRGGSRSRSESSEAPKSANKYVPLYWKVSNAPGEKLPDKDSFLMRIGDTSLLQGNDADFNVCIPSQPVWPLEDISNPQEKLDTYFKRYQSNVKLPLPTRRMSEVDEIDESKILDQKRLEMLGILMQKHIMSHRLGSNREAIEDIKRAVLHCDFDVVKLEGLSILRVVLRHHLQSGSPIVAYVRSQGEAALWRLEHPEYHYLVHELMKVPQIIERLGIMLFRLSYEETMRSCRQNLETLNKALNMLEDKKEILGRFFVTAHRLGQWMMQEETQGFQLSTLGKMSLTRSTKMPHLTILHFVLALMSPEDARSLFTEGDIILLRNANALGTYKVADDCKELASSLYGVKDMCEKGEYTPPLSGTAVKIERRRSSVDVDIDDYFHETMQAFVDLHVKEVDDIANENYQMLLSYRSLAVYFDDLRSVYPPPRKESENRSDLINIFYDFARMIPKYSDDVELEGLHEIVRS